ncbi:MAG TPA: hypothetical protein DCO75_01445 [Fibrobacteres bacterium]|nr:hypothetical protein [Fibrobacterota bacterium]
MAEEIKLVITMDNGQLKVSAGESATAIKTVKKEADDTSGLSKLKGAVEGVQKAFKAFIALEIIRVIRDLAMRFIESADAAEKNKIAFTTLTGSADKATKILKELHDFTDSTTFEFKGVSEVSKQLLAVGVDSENLVPTLQHLADASQGNQGRFEELSQAYARAAGTGLVTFRELRTLTLNQVPIIQALSEQMGISKEAVVSMARSGKVGFKDLDGALTKLTTGAGVFANNMAKYADDFDVKVKVISSNISRLFAGGGTGLESSAKALLDLFIEGTKEGGLFATVLKGIGVVLALIVEFATGAAITLGQMWAKAREMYYTSKMWISEKIGEGAKYGDQQGLDAARADLKKLGDSADAQTERLRKMWRAEKGEESPGGPGIKSGTMNETPQGKGGGMTHESFATMFGSLGEGALAQADKQFAEMKEKLNKFYASGIITKKEYDATLNKLDEDHASKQVQAAAGAAQQQLGFASQMVGQLQSIFQMQDQAEQAHFDKRKQMIDAMADYELQAQLKKYGLQDLTAAQQGAKELQKLQQQYSKTASITKRKDLADQIQQKHHDIQKAKLQEAADKKKKELDLIMDIYKHQMIVREFRRNQQMQIAQASIQMAVGMISAVAMGVAQLGPIAGAIVGAIEAAAIGALGGYSISQIAAQSPPAFAEGGFVLGTQQGTNIIAGDKGGVEAVVPLDNTEQMAKLREGMGGGQTVNVNIHAAYADHQKIGKMIKDTFAANNWQLKPKGSY